MAKGYLYFPNLLKEINYEPSKKIHHFFPKCRSFCSFTVMETKKFCKLAIKQIGNFFRKTLFDTSLTTRLVNILVTSDPTAENKEIVYMLYVHFKE